MELEYYEVKVGKSQLKLQKLSFKRIDGCGFGGGEGLTNLYLKSAGSW